MEDAFELLDPRNAQAFLKTFAADVQRKGEACFRRGCVEELVPENPGTEYFARINNGETYDVCVEYMKPRGWAGECSCEKETGCEHIFAAMRALLAEHSTAAVRSLSGGGEAASVSLAASRNKPDAAESSELIQRLISSRKEPLKREEKKFLSAVHAAFTRCRTYGRITEWDFDEMGLGLSGQGWNALNIWPSVPENEYEFWLYVAYAAHQRGVAIPDFMQPVTDLTLVEKRLERWRRTQEVDKWKKNLALFQTGPGQTSPALAAPTELRLLITDEAAHLQWQRPGQTGFTSVKQTQLRQLAEDHDSGLASFVGESELLWRFFAPGRFEENSPKIEFWDDESVRILGRILRVRQLDGRIVNKQGLPLARPAESLRWELTPPADEDGDYRLRLMQADGLPLPQIHCTVPGKPALYLTSNAILTGPPTHGQMLDVENENLIPAPAIEQPTGVALLRSLGVELPPRISERVRTIPCQVTIRCSLQPAYPGSETEDCGVAVVAEAADGYQQKWSGVGWQPGKAAGKKSREGKNLITVYDSSAMALVPGLLEPLALKPNPYRGGLVLRVTKKFPELFTTWMKTVPPHISLELEGDLASFMASDVAGTVKLEVSEAEIDWFDLRVVLNVSDTTLSQDEIKLLLNARGGYVRLEGRGWRRLQYDLDEGDSERLSKLGLNARDFSAEPQRLHALQLADDAAKKFLPEQQVEQIKRRVGEIKARVTPDLPAGITAQLRPYQLEGFHFLAYLAANHFGGILADDMGLGKTLQTLAWLLWLREGSERANGQGANKIPPSLVVCPKSVMDNWHAEAARFAPGLRVRLWTASQLEKFDSELKSADLHVLNYSQLRLLSERVTPVRWLAVILDEGQYIKNPSSQTAQIARSLRAERRLILTGTPIENRLLDLWSLMSFAMPGVLGSRAQFGKLFDAKDDPFARRRLASRVRPFLLRRTKNQVAKDLPDRTEEDLLCEIEGEQKTLYRAELKRAQQLLLAIKTQKELSEQQFHFLVSLLRLRQICCDPRLLQADFKGSSAKLDALMEQLEPLMEEGQKVLVFSQFVEMLNILRPALEEKQWRVFYLAGQTENRGDLVREFQSVEGPAIFLISLKAGGFGLNLTAASYVVLFDPWWNPAVENQAIDRTHRIGQVNKVIAYRLLIKDSIEEKIRALQKQKKSLAEDVLGEERFAQSLTLSDFQFLFSD